MRLEMGHLIPQAKHPPLFVIFNYSYEVRIENKTNEEEMSFSISKKRARLTVTSRSHEWLCFIHYTSLLQILKLPKKQMLVTRANQTQKPGSIC